MQRELEAELMEDEAQAIAYVEGDFEDAHARFITRFTACFAKTLADRPMRGFVLDLGCGPGDIAIRFARAHPQCTVHGVDGSPAMLAQSERLFARDPDAAGRVQLLEGLLPGATLPRPRYDAIISNSLLHHLPDPAVLWQSVKRWGGVDVPIYVMDLMRPATRQDAERLVETYCSDEPEVLRDDFFNSLLAAFEIGEVREQLVSAGLEHLQVEEASDRHLLVSGVGR